MANQEEIHQILNERFFLHKANICTRLFVPFYFSTKYLVQKKYHEICTIFLWYKKRGTKQNDQNVGWFSCWYHKRSPTSAVSPPVPILMITEYVDGPNMTDRSNVQTQNLIGMPRYIFVAAGLLHLTEYNHQGKVYKQEYTWQWLDRYKRRNLPWCDRNRYDSWQSVCRSHHSH